MALIEYFLKFFRYISMMGVMDVVDVLITAFIIYKLIAIIRRTSSDLLTPSRSAAFVSSSISAGGRMIAM